jgi:pyruvate formate lyase activating enzyme
MSLPTPNQDMHWRPAAFWHRDGTRVVCDLCPFRCTLGRGGVGLCQVRRRGSEGLETATFATSVWHWQPIERKPFYHFRPGLQTLTLAAPGCTFRCDYCQNAVLSQYGREAWATWNAQPVDPAAVVAEAKTRGAAIALSYTEPTLAAELTLALARQAKPHDVPIVWKSNGYLTDQAGDELAPVLSAINIDLKAGDEESHRRLTGAPLKFVLNAMRLFKYHGVWVEVSTPLIEGFNTHPASITRMAQWVHDLGADTPWHLVRFLPEYQRLNTRPTSPEILAKAKAIGQQAGLHYVYVERALGENARNTHCPACGVLLVKRDIWSLKQNHLANGCCPSCGQPISGVW